MVSALIDRVGVVSHGNRRAIGRQQNRRIRGDYPRKGCDEADFILLLARLQKESTSRSARHGARRMRRCRLLPRSMNTFARFRALAPQITSCPGKHRRAGPSPSRIVNYCAQSRSSPWYCPARGRRRRPLR